MIPTATLEAIANPIERRKKAGRAGVVLITHPGDQADPALVGAIVDTLWERELRTVHLRFSALGSTPVLRLRALSTQHQIDVFSLQVGPDTLRLRTPDALQALNLARNAFAREGLCILLWVPSWGMPSFGNRTANFLDFRTRSVEIGLELELLPPDAESPYNFVPAPPPEALFRECAPQLAELEALLRTWPRLVLPGNTWHGWPGGPGALVRAALNRLRLELAPAGVFWIDASEEDWWNTLEELALRMGAELEAPLEQKLKAIETWLGAHPEALLVIDRTLEPERLRERRHGFSLIDLPGRRVVLTPRQDTNLRGFHRASIFAPKPPREGQTATATGVSLLRSLTPGPGIESIALSPAGMLAVGMETGPPEAPSGRLQLYATADAGPAEEEPQLSLKLPDTPVWLSFDPAGERLAIHYYYGSTPDWKDGMGLEVRDIPSGEILLAEQFTSHRFEDGWLPDGALFVAADDALSLYHPLTAPAARATYVPLGGHAVSPDGRRIALAMEGRINVLDRRTGVVLVTFQDDELNRIESLCWSNDGHLLAATGQEWVLVWELKTGLTVARLRVDPVEAREFHSSSRATFALDDRLLYSVYNNLLISRMHVWRCDTWESILYQDSFDAWAIHPRSHLFATVSTYPVGQEIRVWSLDLETLLRDRPTIACVRSRQAGMLLLGTSLEDTRALGEQLARATGHANTLTPGPGVWTLEDREVPIDAWRRERRELLLYVPGPVPEYRLPDLLEGVRAAVFVFRPEGENSLPTELRRWIQCVRQLSDGEASRLRLFVVVLSPDRDTIPMDALRSALDGDLGLFENSLGATVFAIDPFLFTNVEKLAHALKDALEWEAVPPVSLSGPALELQPFLRGLRSGQAAPDGNVLATVDALAASYARHSGTDETPVLRGALEAALSQEAALGLVRRISFGRRVLLEPGRLDAAALEVLRQVRLEASGSGMMVLDELMVRDGEARAGTYTAGTAHQGHEAGSTSTLEAGSVAAPMTEPAAALERRLLRIAALEDLLRHDVATLEADDRLVFPGEASGEPPPDLEVAGRTTFQFRGLVRTLYAAIVVQLSRSGRFMRRSLWKNGAEFTWDDGGRYRLALEEHDAFARLELTFDPACSEEGRLRFEGFVLVKLWRRAGPGLSRECSSCGAPMIEMMRGYRVEQGTIAFPCPACGKDSLPGYPYPMDKVPLQYPPVLELEEMSKRQRDLEGARAALLGKIDTGDFDLFLGHHPEDEIEPLLTRLGRLGVHTWSAPDLPPLERWFDEVIAPMLPRVRYVAVLLGPHALVAWHPDRLEPLVRRCLEAGKQPLLVLATGIEAHELPPAWSTLGTPRLPGRFTGGVQFSEVLRARRPWPSQGWWTEEALLQLLERDVTREVPPSAGV